MMHRLVLVWEGDLQGTRQLLGFAVLPSPFMATTDSSFQNTYEYLAILLGLLLTKTLGLRNCVFAVSIVVSMGAEGSGAVNVVSTC